MSEHIDRYALITRAIRNVPDFPKPGILFKDITPLLANPEAFNFAVDELGRRIAAHGADCVVGIESRGFIFGAAVASKHDLPLQLVRKPGKLPYRTVGISYDLEYGSDRVEMHEDAVQTGMRYAIIDDLIATGGTAGAAVKLIEQQGGTVCCSAFVIELADLGGRKRLGNHPIETLVRY